MNNVLSWNFGSLHTLVVIGTFSSSIVSTNVYGAIDSFQNKVDIVTDSKHKNDCDEHDAGANNADCSYVDETATDQISMIGKNNKFVSNINVIRFKNVMKRVVVTTVRNAPIIAVISLMPLIYR